MRHVVSRAIPAGDYNLEPGEVVDTSKWRFGRPESLLESRRLMVPEPGLDPITCICGRNWVDEAAIERHGCKRQPEPESAAPRPSPAVRPNFVKPRG